MSIFVTATGFIKKTLVEIKSELEASFQEIFGPEIDLDPRGPAGQLIGLMAKREADLWDGAEEIYTSRNPNQATGTSLDGIVAENGIERLDPTASVVEDVLLYTEALTLPVPAGSKVRPDGSDLTFSLGDDVLVDDSHLRDCYMTPDSATPGTSYGLTLDGQAVTYTAIGGDTEEDILNELKTQIDSLDWDGDCFVTEIESTWTMRLYQPTSDFIVAGLTNITINLKAGAGTFVCDETGPNYVAENTLIIIVTPVLDWDSVNNPSSGIQGTDIETDEALRIRRRVAINTGLATEEAIRSKLLNDVDGVISVSIASNRSDVTDGEGRPPHSFEAVVSGGTSQAVADKIWETMPAGIASFGNTSETVVDSQGNTQTVYFSRPDSVYIWVRVSRDYDTEEDYPADGDDQIKQNILDYAQTYIGVGKDVIRQRLSIPIYEVPGIGDIVIEIAATATPGGSPSYSENNIVISAREIADFAISRMTVQDIP